MNKTIKAELFAEPASSVFAVIDGASAPELLETLYKHQPEYVCLFRGNLAPDMARVAPYLVRLDPGAELSNWIVEQGWGKHWGVFAVANADFLTMRQHFRKFLTVHDSEGRSLRFRYYDPRVLRVFLPTCNAEDLDIIFGPVQSYLLEGEEPDILMRFQHASGALRSEEKRLEA